ncbi:MAG: MBL fold metallo-hydrolase [Oscillospiraceae bacterium]|nr:MBL fold metallo-hydrolase [Oscillospiraceae bacterium]
MFFEQVGTPGLGCYSYMVGCPAAGVMAVVDPKRDIGAYLRASKGKGMAITDVFETHVHADHVSGAQELRAATGARVRIHESARVGYEAAYLRDGERFAFGQAVMTALHTPGHTPESTSFLVSDLARGAEPGMILTGDLLFVGDVGRPDLPGSESMEALAASLYDSLYKVLAPLPDHLEVFPAHGEGSLCGGGMGAKPSSTLGYERAANPMLRHANSAVFRDALLSRLPMRPQSFSHIIRLNKEGAPLAAQVGDGEGGLSAAETYGLIRSGATVLDLRDAYSFGSAHIPGSVSVDFSDGPKLNWLGVAVPPDRPLALVLPVGLGYGDAMTELQRIGYDDVRGWLKGGMNAWISAGGNTRGTPYVSASALRAHLDGPNPPTLVDVRTPSEYAGGHIDGAVNFTFEAIVKGEGCPKGPCDDAVVICKSGFRAGIAASLLEAKGCGSLRILAGGMVAWDARGGLGG